MSVEVRVHVRPTSRQLRHAVLRGVATAIVEETKAAYLARSKGEPYENNEEWKALDEAWVKRKQSEERPTDIGIYNGELLQDVLKLSYEILGNSISIKIDSDHAEFFNKERPILYIPDSDTIRGYIHESLKEVGNDN